MIGCLKVEEELDNCSIDDFILVLDDQMSASKFVVPYNSELNVILISIQGQEPAPARVASPPTRTASTPKMLRPVPQKPSFLEQVGRQVTVQVASNITANLTDLATENLVQLLSNMEFQ